MRAVLGLVAAMALGAGSAQAAIVFNVNATFSTGGTLTGNFTTDNGRTMVTAFDLTASAAGTFAGFEYTNLNSSVTAQSLPSQYFRINQTSGVDQLQLYFNAPGLTATGGTFLMSSSIEAEPGGGGNRLVSGAATLAPAAVSGAPEPASWALLLGGVGALGGMLRAAGALRRERDVEGAALG